MLLRFFKSPRPYIYILLPLLATALWFKSLLNPVDYPFFSGENNMPLYQLFTIILKSAFIQVIAGLVLLVFCAFMVERINSRFAFVRVRTMLAAPLFILFISGIPGLHVLHPVYFATVFFLFFIFRFFSAFDVHKPYSHSFDSGFLLGVGTLFYLNLVVLLLPFLIGMSLLNRESRWREPLIQLSGFLLPLIFTFTFYFVTDNLKSLLIILKENFLTLNLHVRGSFPLLTYLGFLFILIFLSSVYILGHYEDRKISSRKYFQVLFLFFIFMAAAFVFIPSGSQELLVLTAVPVSFLAANYMASIKSRFWGELFFTLLLIGVVAMQFINDFNIPFLQNLNN
jgi:hypothetical protein